MRNHNNGATVLGQKAFEPLQGFHVQVIGGLVQQQNIWLAKHRQGQVYHCFLPAAEHIVLPVQQGGKAETLGDFCQAFFHAITALLLVAFLGGGVFLH